jgi:uncharacterized protein (TIGR01777 family)
MSTVETFSLTTRIERPADEVFAWHERPGAFARLIPPFEEVEVIEASDHIRDGAKVKVRNKFGPMWMDWTVEHRGYVAGREFRDVQLSGPFAHWEHVHRFEPQGTDACLLTDQITYRLPGGVIGRAVGNAKVRGRLERLFRWRHAVTKADLELTRDPRTGKRLRVVIAGASGLIGQALVPFLQTRGHDVLRLVRRPTARKDEVHWNPIARTLDSAALEGVDVVVNLAGENIAAGRWTAVRRDAILRSRVDATQTLLAAVRNLQRRPEVFFNASAVGFYGNRGDDLLTEESSVGHGFLSEVCLAWETHAEGVRTLGVRSVLGRFGVVLSPKGGALRKLLPLFRAGLGGRVGNGEQWMSWITIDDVVAAIYHTIVDRHCDGPMNFVAAQPVRNREFTSTLAEVLNRPAVLPVPGGILRSIFGEMAEQTLLASNRVVPERLKATGFRYRCADLETALRHVCGCHAAIQSSGNRMKDVGL